MNLITEPTDDSYRRQITIVNDWKEILARIEYYGSKYKRKLIYVSMWQCNRQEKLMILGESNLTRNLVNKCSSLIFFAQK